MGALERRRDLLLLVFKVPTTTVGRKGGREGVGVRERERGKRKRGVRRVLIIVTKKLMKYPLYLEDNGATLADGWEGAALSSEKGLNVYNACNKGQCENLARTRCTLCKCTSCHKAHLDIDTPQANIGLRKRSSYLREKEHKYSHVVRIILFWTVCR